MNGELDAYETGYQDGLGETAKEIRELKKKLKQYKEVTANLQIAKCWYEVETYVKMLKKLEESK